YRTDGERAVILSPLKKEKTDVFVVKKKIEKAITDFKTRAPASLKISIINDFSYYVQRRLNVLVSNGLIGLVLVIIPIFLFLSHRAALCACMGMLVAFLTTLAMMQFMGISINLLSMFGLIMVIGMLVDEDIVIAENIHRHLQEGKSYWEATIVGTTEVTRSVVATVLTTIIAFIPLMTMTGIMGKFVRHIPEVIIIALMASLFEALFILPVHMATLSKKGEKEEKGEGDSFQERFFGQKTINVIGRWIRYCVERRYKVLGIFVLMMMGTVALWYWRIDYINFPKKGVEAFFVRAELERGTPLEKTVEQMKSLEKIILTLPPEELDHFVTEVGLSQNDPTDPFTKRGSYLGQIKVFLTPESKRDREADEILDQLRPLAAQITGFKKISFDGVQAGPPSGKPVAIRLKGDDLDKLLVAVPQVEKIVSGLEGVSDVVNDFQIGKEERRVVIDPKKVAQSGLTLSDVAQSVRFAFEGGSVTTVKKGDEDWDVLVKFPEALRYQPDSLLKVKISNPVGDLVPLSAVASFEKDESIEALRHYNRKQTITVSAQVDQRISSSLKVNREVKEILEKEKILDPRILVDFGGEAEDTTESLQSLFHAFGLALLLVVIVMAVTLGSLMAPLIILFTTVTLGLMGVVIGFSITGEPLNFLALMGIVGMSGVVVDAAILIVDFVHRMDAKGLPPLEAVIEGTKLRIRPIILTTATTILGIIPAATGLGGSDPFIKPMARALNWGIGFGALSTLILLPAIMGIARDLKGWWEGR
ncbi:MAG: efflux RND transporter permease subunit, partial [bacterium]|nr:efflux RND transporter permease subunit [bacterium]